MAFFMRGCARWLAIITINTFIIKLFNHAEMTLFSFTFFVILFSPTQKQHIQLRTRALFLMVFGNHELAFRA